MSICAGNVLNTTSFLGLFAATCSLALPAVAEEGGSGHYFPGSMASFLDGVSAEPTFITRLNVIDYDGKVDLDREIPYAGLIAANADAESTVIGLTFFWAPDWDIGLGNNWSYGMSATIPYVDITVEADARSPGSDVSVRRRDSDSGLGDIVLMPFMLNYQSSPDFNVNMRLGFYAPTGSYETGRLANTSKNFWTIEPAVGFVYFGQKNGREASLYIGADFNQENSDTNYKSGTQVHADGTLAQHFPLWGGVAGAGITGYWYRQVKGDSGSGATLGSFKARANGIGPVASYITKLNGREVITEFKWINEFGNQNRVEGDIVWLKIMGSF